MASIRNWKGEKRVLEDSFDRIYTKFKLHFYQAVFSRFQTREEIGRASCRERV